MNTLFYKLFLIGTVAIMLTACTKTVDIKLPDYEKKLTIEGSIEQDQYAEVIVTRNMAYFGTTDSASLANTVVMDAVVIVSDGVINDTLQLTFNPNYFPPLIYKGSKLKGQLGKSYSLKVIADQQTLTAQTTIPFPTAFDSLWFKVEENKDSLGYIWATFNDSPKLGEYYRIFTKRLSRDNKYIPLWGSVYDDKLFNGQKVTFNFYRGFESYSDEESFQDTTAQQEFGFYRAGDTIIVRNCSMDQAHYDFWMTYEQALFGGDNPFGNPIRIKSNINGGLGIWGGYGANYDTIIAK